MGALVGFASGGTIDDSYATGIVAGGGRYAGGLVAFAFDTAISKSYAAGVTVGYISGGFVGTGGGALSIASSWSSGPAVGTLPGPFFSTGAAAMTNCYYAVTGDDGFAGTTGLDGAAAFADAASYVTMLPWNLADIWLPPVGGNPPLLR
jgi:hypothetical protein